MARIIVETSKVGDIPILTVIESGRNECPLVFFLHGFTSDKRQGLAFGYELALRGVRFVAFDAMMHGERVDPKQEAAHPGKVDHVYPEDSGLDTYFLMQKIIIQTGEDIAALIAHFNRVEGDSDAAVRVAGDSMGGFASFYVAAANPDVQAAVPIVLGRNDRSVPGCAFESGFVQDCIGRGPGDR